MLARDHLLAIMIEDMGAPREISVMIRRLHVQVSYPTAADILGFVNGYSVPSVIKDEAAAVSRFVKSVDGEYRTQILGKYDRLLMHKICDQLGLPHETLMADGSRRECDIIGCVNGWIGSWGKATRPRLCTCNGGDVTYRAVLITQKGAWLC